MDDKPKTLSELEERGLSSPDFTIGFFFNRGRVPYTARQVRALFNHAAAKQPQDLVTANDDANYEIGLVKKANLIYRANRRAGSGVVESAKLFVQVLAGYPLNGKNHWKPKQ